VLKAKKGLSNNNIKEINEFQAIEDECLKSKKLKSGDD